MHLMRRNFLKNPLLKVKIFSNVTKLEFELEFEKKINQSNNSISLFGFWSSSNEEDLIFKKSEQKIKELVKNCHINELIFDTRF
jgi:hypothetical protein